MHINYKIYKDYWKNGEYKGRKIEKERRGEREAAKREEKNKGIRRRKRIEGERDKQVLNSLLLKFRLWPSSIIWLGSTVF